MKKRIEMKRKMSVMLVVVVVAAVFDGRDPQLDEPDPWKDRREKDGWTSHTTHVRPDPEGEKIKLRTKQNTIFWRERCNKNNSTPHSIHPTT